MRLDMQWRFLYLLAGLLCLSACRPDRSGQETSAEKAYLDQIQPVLDSLYEAFSYGEMDSTSWMNSLEAVRRESLTHFPGENLVMASICHCRGKALYRMGHVGDAIDQFHESIRIKQQILPDSDPDIARSYYNIGVILYRSENYFEALNHTLRAAAYPEHLPENLKTDVYKALSLIYKNIGDLDHAKSYLEHAILIAREEVSNTTLPERNEREKSLASLCNDMAVLLAIELREPSEARSYALEALSVYKVRAVNRKDSAGLANSWHNLGVTMEMMDSIDQALTAYSQSLQINRAIYREDPFIGKTLDNLGITFKKSGDYLKAIRHSREAMHYFDPVFDKTRYGYLYDNLADSYLLLGRIDSALIFYQQAIRQVVTGYAPHSVFSLPRIGQSQITDKSGLFVYLSSLAEALVEKFETTKDIHYLQLALTSFEKVDSLVTLMRLEYRSDASKESLVALSKPVYEHSIDCCYQLLSLTLDPVYLHRAFDFSEKSKSVILLEAARRATIAAGFRTEAEKTIHLKRNHYEKELALARMNGEGPERQTVWMDSLSKYRTEHARIMAEIEREHPGYQAHQKNTWTVPMESIRDSMLSNDQVLIAFFTGEEAIYTFVVNQQAGRLFRIPVDSTLERANRQFQKAIRTQAGKPYLQSAHALYLSLLHPIKDLLDEMSEWIIIPDGWIAHVPFDALLRSIPDQGVPIHFKNLDYLINERAISYRYSASHWYEVLTSSTPDRAPVRIAAFAPSIPKAFGPESAPELPVGSLLGPLENNGKEVRSLRKQLGAKVFIGSRATTGQLAKQAENFAVFHLATHGQANETSGDYSFVVFSGSKKEHYDLLFAKDLYTWHLPAKMVVLSACETQRGEWRSGEGVIGLARGFSYAGCQSLVSTQWLASESATGVISERFYHELARGNDKARALREAKLHYLQAQKINRKAHPFFWSGFILVGDTKPLYSRKNNR